MGDEQLHQLNDHLKRAQRVLAEYLPPDSGKTPEDAIGELLGILDSRELVRLQAEIASPRALIES